MVGEVKSKVPSQKTGAILLTGFSAFAKDDDAPNLWD